MARYLTKYVGTYRVKAMYDLGTNDFPRGEDGNIDPSFDDLYIPCKADCMIRHAYKDVLSAYFPSKQRGRNIVAEIKEKHGNIIFDIEETSMEMIFLFKAVDIDKIADIMDATTNGKNVSPFSVKNLPKSKYTIPEKDMELYKVLVADIPFNEIAKISKIYSKFDKEITKKKGKKYDVEFERKKSALKPKEFIHNIGLWNEFIEFLKKELSKLK